MSSLYFPALIYMLTHKKKTLCPGYLKVVFVFDTTLQQWKKHTRAQKKAMLCVEYRSTTGGVFITTDFLGIHK